MSLYAASVPVFARYLGQAARMAERASEAQLAQGLADALPAGAQLATAAGYALRVACPLAGRAVPDLPEGADKTALARRFAAVQAELARLAATDFIGAEARVICHRAGFADLEQDGATFLHQYGMPNFMFHLTMGYASLRAAGLALGKADFDGLHHYPGGFRFS
ncbi:DUF1993 family protein [Fertoebacter nigrum]|uniref:DUF1993 family protein n=1 Tax=Fertoeibacter niger TaxID=2656921 RepID=A0A8X8GZV5_9RHOB|nr:DUF1993 family protein [Fertoeibacter niger]NUB44335.1 DUF1993 family protein [Fertoeibacter niger]